MLAYLSNGEYRKAMCPLASDNASADMYNNQSSFICSASQFSPLEAGCFLGPVCPLHPLIRLLKSCHRSSVVYNCIVLLWLFYTFSQNKWARSFEQGYTWNINKMQCCKINKSCCWIVKSKTCHDTGCLWVNFKSKILAVGKVVLIVAFDGMSCQTVADDSFHFALWVIQRFTCTLKCSLTFFIPPCPQEIPQQMNGSDCGMFTCKYADYITKDKPITFTQVITKIGNRLTRWNHHQSVLKMSLITFFRLIHRNTCPTLEEGWFGKFWTISCCDVRVRIVNLSSQLMVLQTRVVTMAELCSTVQPLDRRPVLQRICTPAQQIRNQLCHTPPPRPIKPSADLGWWDVAGAPKHCLPVLVSSFLFFDAPMERHYSSWNTACFILPSQNCFF